MSNIIDLESNILCLLISVKYFLHQERLDALCLLHLDTASGRTVFNS